MAAKKPTKLQRKKGGARKPKGKGKMKRTAKASPKKSGKAPSISSKQTIIEKKRSPIDVGKPGPEMEIETPEKKRVSFARKLVKKSDSSPGKKTELTISYAETTSEVDTPLKPILKRKKGTSAISQNGTGAKSRRIQMNSVLQSGGNSPKGEKENGNVEEEEKNSENGTETLDEDESVEATKKKDDKIRVTKSVKEELQGMTKKERREYLRQLRAKRKPYFEIAVKAKKLWEKIRSKRRGKAEEREQLIEQLYSLVEGKVKQMIYAHDTVRVIQCLMALKKHGELRTKLFEEVKDEVLQMAKSKYAKFFVIKMLKYGSPAQREYVIQQFYGKIPDLLKQSMASEVVEYAYNEYANALQRSRMVSEFYSPEFALWKVDEAVSLNEILEAQPARKAAILQSMKEHVLSLSTKPVLRHTIVHRLIKEFFEHCDETDRKEVIDSLKERVIEMIHTKDGVICAMKCIWYGTTKDRRTIVQTFKSLVTKTCCEEHGHLSLLAIFDVVKDTAVLKIILKEIQRDLDQIVKNKHGMKVLHYLLKPRSGIHFIKPIVTLLAEGDKVTSQEDMSARHAELLEYISPSLLSYCIAHMEELMLDSHACLLVLSILENALGDKSEAYRSLCNDVLAEEFIPMNLERLHPIETPHCHFVLKRLIQHDKGLHGRNESTFSETLITELNDDHLLSWISCNKGAFVLVYMYETGISNVQEKITSVANSPSGKKKLKQYTFPAAKILTKKCLQSGSTA